MRVCGYCEGELEWKSGEERSAREQAGNAGHWWGVRDHGREEWANLAEKRWPRLK